MTMTKNRYENCDVWSISRSCNVLKIYKVSRVFKVFRATHCDTWEKPPTNTEVNVPASPSQNLSPLVNFSLYRLLQGFKGFQGFQRQLRLRLERTLPKCACQAFHKFRFSICWGISLCFLLVTSWCSTGSVQFSTLSWVHHRTGSMRSGLLSAVGITAPHYSNR